MWGARNYCPCSLVSAFFRFKYTPIYTSRAFPASILRFIVMLRSDAFRTLTNHFPARFPQHEFNLVGKLFPPASATHMITHTPRRVPRWIKHSLDPTPKLHAPDVHTCTLLMVFIFECNFTPGNMCRSGLNYINFVCAAVLITAALLPHDGRVWSRTWSFRPAKTFPRSISTSHYSADLLQIGLSRDPTTQRVCWAKSCAFLAICSNFWEVRIHSM